MPEEYIQVVCLVMPNGTNLWFECDETINDRSYIRAIMEKWDRENPEYENTPCTCGAVAIMMPRSRYIAIGASIGGGAFEFPARG